jgi:putative hydrolase of the HAD superfamily
MGEARRILGVVFDAVGTLLLLREPVGETYTRLAAAHGVTLPAGRLDEAFRRVLAEAKPNVHPGMTLALVAERERGWWRERVRETFRAADGMAQFDDFDAFFGGLWAHYAEASAWRLASGALACLDALAARGLRLGVLSNFDQRLRRLLAALGLAERFDVITLPADAGAAKPARAIFEHCLGQIGLAAASVLYVGDRATLDVMAARQAGLLALDVGGLSDLSALPDMIDRIERECGEAGR